LATDRQTNKEQMDSTDALSRSRSSIAAARQSHYNKCKKNLLKIKTSTENQCFMCWTDCGV